MRYLRAWWNYLYAAGDTVPPESNTVLITTIAIVVLFVWTVATFAAIYQHDAAVLGIVSPIMFAIVGGLLAFNRKTNGA